jgi:hypothetical protein
MDYRYKERQRQSYSGVNVMGTDKEQLDVEDDLVESEDDGVEAPVAEVAKTNLSKRRTIDNLLEERRLQKQLADYDFDL